MRAFALAARRRPAEGDLFNASAASGSCNAIGDPLRERLTNAGIATEIVETGTVGSHRLKAIERHRRRCAGFVGDETQEMYRSIQQEATNRSDPLMNAVMDVRIAKRGNDSDAAWGAMQALMDLRDPLLSSQNQTFLATIGRAGNQPPLDMWFEGRNDGSSEDAGLHQQALQLAACTPNAPCSTDDEVLVTCMLSGGFCPDNPSDLFFKAPYAADQPPGYNDAVRRLADRMHAAIVRSAVALFLQPSAIVRRGMGAA